MDFNEIMKALEGFGSEQTKKVLTKHGAREPFFGVKVADLKKIQKKIKKNYKLSKELYASGNSDAMYLAGLISEPDKMTRDELQDWAEKAYWYMIAEYTVSGVTAESPYGYELAKEWIASGDEKLMECGWATLSAYISVKPNEELNIDELKEYLKMAEENVHTAPNRVRYTMNNFIIALGSYVPEFKELAIASGMRVGKVHVDMGGTACKVPLADEYIKKVEARNKIGVKRKTAIC